MEATRPHIRTYGDELIAVYATASGSATQRRTNQIDVEDFIVGLWYALGGRVSKYFETSKEVEQFVSQLCPKRPDLLKIFDLKNVATKARLREEGKVVGYRAPFFEQAETLRNAFDRAAQACRAQGRREIDVDDMIQSLAQEESVCALLAQNGIRFRADLGPARAL